MVPQAYGRLTPSRASPADTAAVLNRISDGIRSRSFALSLAEDSIIVALRILRSRGEAPR